MTFVDISSIRVDKSEYTQNSESIHRVVAEFLRLNAIPAEESQIEATIGPNPSSADIIRVLKTAGLKVGVRRLALGRLGGAPMPALALTKAGGVRLIVRITKQKILYFDHLTNRPAIETPEEFAATWSGTLILSRRKASFGIEDSHFSIRWFFSVMRKYRGILSEVLVASFFLQIFALATPFAFQILVDKVLVNRGLSTLDVVIAGLVTVAIFEAVLGGLRNFVFAHTTNRVDVELGAKLFRHLVALPLSYFQSRRVGDSVARIRELETIRQFLTGSALGPVRT